MYYKLVYNMDLVDYISEKGERYIYCDNDNLDEIEYSGYQKGFFTQVLYSDTKIDWPNVEFYYNSLETRLESDYLGNIASWPLLHKNVISTLRGLNLQGVEFYPIKVIDEITEEINKDYFVLHITNLVDAFDMKNSKYRHNEKYDAYFFDPKGEQFDYEKVRGHDILREIHKPTVVFVSESFRQLVIEKGWTGFCFYRIPTSNEERKYIEEHGVYA